MVLRTPIYLSENDVYGIIIFYASVINLKKKYIAVKAAEYLLFNHRIH